MAASLVGGSVSRASVIVLLEVLLLAATPVLPAGANPHRPHTGVADIDRFLSAELEESAIPGAAVAVTRGDRVLMVRGYGTTPPGRR